MCSKIVLLFVCLLLTIPSIYKAEVFKTKVFSIELPSGWDLASSSEKKISDTAAWKKFGAGPVTEAYGYNFSLSTLKERFTFPWCNILVSISACRAPLWRVSKLGGEKYETEKVNDIKMLQSNSSIYESSTFYNWYLKTFSQNNKLMQRLSVYIPIENGGVSFVFTVEKDSFPKYESAVFKMIKSIKISNQLKYRQRFIEKFPIVDRVYYYAVLSFPVNILAITGIGIIIFGFIGLKRNKKRQ